MKKLKTNYGKLLTMVLLLIGIAFVQSCDKDDDPVVVVKTELLAKIAEANNLIATTEEGSANGQYAPGSQATLQAVIDIAQLVNDNADATQTEVDNSVANLTSAIAAYEAQANTPIAPDDLIAHWTFDDGAGTTLTDLSGNGFDGTFAIHLPELGGGNPEWTTDRYGSSNKALNFADGAWVKVPYNGALNPKQITIAAWVNADVTRANNKILGLHEWQGYKLQLQDANKVFFTVNDGAAAWDKDSDPAFIEINTWYHIAVTYGSSEMVFFINGAEVARETRDGFGDLKVVDGHDFAIGADIDIPWDGWTLENGSFFNGSIDELRLYKSVLTPAQILSIYNLEKVPE